jgi:amino acid adenylation domain-containing protein
LLTDSALFFDQDYYLGKAFLLDLELSGIPESAPGRPGAYNPASLAYVIYTSGTTGVPKGVLIRHYGLMNNILEQIRIYGVLPEDRVLQFSSISFDASPSEIFKGLCSGARLVITDRALGRDAGTFLDHVKKAGVTLMTLPPSYQSALGWEELLFLRILISAGEKLNVRRALELSRNMIYINGYGPSECTIGCAYNKIEPHMTLEEAECIGFPISNVQIYILTPDLYPVPIGITGEIFIGGAGVALGYQHREALTEEKFILNPFSDVPGARLYRSGDYGRWRPDGRIAFAGRRDDQIKIRGFRVEIGEIEQVLQLHQRVRQSAILVKEDDKGEKRLVAFVVTDGEFSRKELVDHLAARLPEYMVPGLWINLHELPMTNNGKVDKKALLALSAAGKAIEEHAGPRNSTEEKLVDIWKEVLQQEKVGIYDDFFELGGDSLTAIRLMAFIREAFSLNVPVNALFEFTTISDLAEYLYVIAADTSDSNDTGTEVLLV